MQITIRNWDGEPTEFEVQPECTIEELKIRIDVREGINPDQQILTFNGRRLTEENRTLMDYEVNEGSILTLVRPRHQPQMQITIQIITGRRFQLQVDAEDTVRDVKTKIQEHCGRSPPEQILLLRGRPIQENATLRGTGVKNNTVLHLVFRLRGGESTAYPRYIFDHICEEVYYRDFASAIAQLGFQQQSGGQLIPVTLSRFVRLQILRPILLCSWLVNVLIHFIVFMMLVFFWFVIDKISNALHD